MTLKKPWRLQARNPVRVTDAVHRRIRSIAEKYGLHYSELIATALDDYAACSAMRRLSIGGTPAAPECPECGGSVDAQ